MAIGNLEAIRDWMKDTWYNKEEINNLILQSNGPLYDVNSPFYSKDAGTVCTAWYQSCDKTADGECYSGMLYGYNGGYSYWCAFCLSLSQETTQAMNYRYGKSNGTIIHEGKIWYYSVDAQRGQYSYGQNVDNTNPSTRRFYYREGPFNIDEWLKGLLNTMNLR